jgi:glycogen synthase
MELLLVTRAIYPIHGYGGLERHCHDWVFALSKLDCRIHVVTLPPGEKANLSGFPKEVSFYFIPGTNARTVLQRITTYPAWTERVSKFLAKLTKEKTFHAIYAQGLAAAGCTRLNAPLYYNPHGMEEFKCRGIKHLAYSSFRNRSLKAATLSHKVVATDQSLVPEIQEFLKVTDDRIVLIPNAVTMTDTEPGQSAAERTAPIFLSVGRLEPNKGFDLLLRAFAIARNLPPEWKAYFVGTGSEQESLQTLAQKLDLADRVNFIGTIPDHELEALYDQVGLFLHPALYEGSSIVTLEAMKHGLPIVATRTGGLPDKVFPGKNGWLVPPSNAEALASALEEACSQMADWPAFGDASYEIARDRFSWDHAAKQFLELFKNS